MALLFILLSLNYFRNCFFDYNYYQMKPGCLAQFLAYISYAVLFEFHSNFTKFILGRSNEHDQKL